MTSTQKQDTPKPANRKESGRNKAGQFLPGCSGNPAGRPKRLETEAQTLAAIYTLAPLAVQNLAEILNSTTTKADTKLKAIEIILDRTCGKAVPRDELENLELDPHNILEYLQRKRKIAEEYF